MQKQCHACLELKNIGGFSRCAANRDGLQNKCRQCCDEYARINRHRFRAKKAAYDRMRRKRDAVKIAAQQSAYGKKNRAKLTRHGSAYYVANRAKILAQRNARRAKNRERINAANRARYKSDHMRQLVCKLRARTYEAFKSKRWIKSGGSSALLGCTWNEARAHIEAKFRPGMAWGDGSFEIDHIIPLASAKNPDELAALCRYTNLQPLPMFENRRKSGKVDFFIGPSTAEEST